MTDDKALYSALLAKTANWPTTGFTANSSYPSVTAENFWDWLLKYLIDGTLPPGTRAFCGVSIPELPVPPQS